MWLFTPFGFFSVVAKDAPADCLCVRARAREDLEALLDRAKSRAEIVRTPTADYPFRVYLPRTVVSSVMAAFVESELDYPNFKTEVARAAGYHRAAPLHHVWTAMLDVEDPAARTTPARSRARSAARL